MVLIFLLFFALLFFDNQNLVTIEREPTKTSTNTLILGQQESSHEPQVFFCIEENCKELIVSLIEDSNKSIDCAIYDISSREIVDALISEKKKGSEIRIVTDKGRSQTKTTLVGDLKSTGVDVLISPSESSYMHNKFCVFDDNISLVGSANFTENSFSKSHNNILVFKDAKFSKELTQKIDSFYLGNFSKLSTALGKTFDDNFSLFFCPNDNCKYQIISMISTAEDSISCMMYSFTLDDFGDEMVKAKERGVNVKIVFESQQISQYSEYQKLKAMGVYVFEDNCPYLMHNKYCIFDNQIITTGSMNFSINGTNKNDETLIIINNQKLAEKYTDNFENYLNNKAN